MNIKEAKQEIKQAIEAYFTKNEYGEYVISTEKQRPIFLLGAPGIGKTAIMEQIAQELGVALVSYSMTHHTRQSALGLPFIVEKEYGGEKYSVSEYTMSEIIASVYDAMESSGLKEGILFLDEINCVSETLAPSMLQFLQYKIFGRHKVPNGWIVVTAGNPPEYNNSVREFDIVTWDRLKRIDVEPNYDVWKEYAFKVGTHPSITSYLEIKKANFYSIETTVDGKSFVTARGWSDLSEMIKLYEQHNFIVNEDLIVQYLQNKKIAKDFAIYYDLFNKYKADYQVDKIIQGKTTDEIKERARNARFDERLSLIGLLLDAVFQEIKEVINAESVIKGVLDALKIVKAESARPNADVLKSLARQIIQNERKFSTGQSAQTLSIENQHILKDAIAALYEEKELLMKESPADATSGFKLLYDDYNKRQKDFKKNVEKGKTVLSNMFAFVEEVFEEGQEILIIVTELTINYYTVQFISHYGCKEYFNHNKELLFYERQKEIITRLENLGL